MVEKVIRFWSLKVDSRTLAIYRMAFALIAAAHLIFTIPHPVGFYYGGGGLVSPMALRTELMGWSPLHLLGEQGVTVLLVLHWIALAMLFLGYYSRIAAIVCWLWHLTVVHLTPYNGWHSDYLLCVINFYLIFIPLDGAWTFRGHRPGTSGETRDVICPSLRFIQLYLSILYGASAVAKIRSSQWTGGTAMRDFMLGWLVDSKVDLPLALSFWLGLSVIALELGIALFLWFPRTRAIAFGCALILHIGILFTTRIQSFSVIAIALQIFYLNPWLDSMLKRHFPKSLTRTLSSN